MKKIALLFCAVLSVFVADAAAVAADDYPGYYVSFAYDAEGKGNPAADADGFPAEYVAHLQLNGDGTYEMLIFCALTVGEWKVMKSRGGNEFVGMTIDKTTDEALEKRYGTGKLSFMLARHATADNTFRLMQVYSDEVVYMGKRDGALDVDEVIEEIQRHLSGED